MAEHELWTHPKIQVHRGKTHVWNRSGRKPPSCDEMQRAAEAADPNARVWRGSEPPQNRASKYWGALWGMKICCKPSPQCLTSSLLLLHCAAARANYQLRVLRPDVVSSFARAHDAGVWQCLCAVLRIPDTSCEEVARLSASLPLALGGLGLRSAVRTSAAAHWASWADTLPMIHQRHPVVATRIVHALAQEVDSPVLGAVRRAAQELEGVSGFVVPSWPALTAGLRPPPREPEFHEPGGPRAGWQHEAASSVERQFRTMSVLPLLSPTGRAMLRSQSGPAAGVAFSALPSSPLTRFQPALFRVLLQRRCSSLTFDFAQLPVWPSS